MNERDIKRQLERHEFYHVIQLTDTISTPGNPDFVRLQVPVLNALKTLDLSGKRVLDVGCRDGLFSFAAEKAGALEVVGIDNDLSKGAVEFLIPFFDSKVEMYELNLYDLTVERFGKFDVIMLPGVLYHLRYPFWGLKILRDLINSNGFLIVETAIFYGVTNKAMLFCPIGDESPYEPTSCAFFNKKGLIDTLATLGFRTLSTSVLNPALEAQSLSSPEPITDRAVFVSRFTGHCGSTLVDQYWHGCHDAHTRYGADRERAIARGRFDWKPDSESE